MSQVSDIIGAIADLVEAIDALVQTDSFKELVNIVKQLGLEKAVVPVLSVICGVLDKVVSWLGTLERITALPRITEPLMMSFADIQDLTDMSPPGKKEDLEELGWGGLIPVAEAANVATGLFTRLGRVAGALTDGPELEKKIGLLRTRMGELKKTFDDYRRQLAAPTSAAAPGAASSGAPRLMEAVA
jgi:hypothetical protein